MAPSTSAQRLGNLEGQMTSLQNSIAEQITSSVSLAMEAVKHSIAEQISEKREEAVKKSKEELEIASFQLGGRIDRTRENIEGAMSVIRREQEKFRRETLESLRTQRNPSREPRDLDAAAVGQGILGNEEGENRGGRNGGESEHFSRNGGEFGRGGSGGGPGNLWGRDGGSRGGGNWRHKKLDMPGFEGTDPDGWFLRAEKFFSFYGLSESEKMEAAVVAMEGDALRWYQWENKRNPIVSWESLKEFILLQFRPTNGGSLYEQWLATSQTTTVQDYRRKFVDMAAPLESIPEAILLGKFIHGLKEEIQTEMRVLSPLNLEQAMDLALKIEEKNKVIGLRKVHEPGSYRSGYSLYNRTPSSSSSGQTNVTNGKSWALGSSESQASVNTPKSSLTSVKPFGEMRRLTEKELQEKRARGLCYRCDEKWHAGHRCRRRELSVLLIDDAAEEVSDGDFNFSEPPLSPTEETPPEFSVFHLIR